MAMKVASAIKAVQQLYAASVHAVEDRELLLAVTVAAVSAVKAVQQQCAASVHAVVHQVRL